MLARPLRAPGDAGPAPPGHAVASGRGREGARGRDRGSRVATRSRPKPAPSAAKPKPRRTPSRGGRRTATEPTDDRTDDDTRRRLDGLEGMLRRRRARHARHPTARARFRRRPRRLTIVDRPSPSTPAVSGRHPSAIIEGWPRPSTIVSRRSNPATKPSPTSWPRPRSPTTRSACATWAGRSPSCRRSCIPTVSTGRSRRRRTRRGRWRRPRPSRRWPRSSATRPSRPRRVRRSSAAGSSGCSSRRIPNDGKDLIVEIRAGTGGQEAALWAGGPVRDVPAASPSGTGGRPTSLVLAGVDVGGFKEVVARGPRQGCVHATEARGGRAPRAAGAGHRIAGAASTRRRRPWRSCPRPRRWRSRSGRRTSRSTSTGRRARAVSR